MTIQRTWTDWDGVTDVRVIDGDTVRVRRRKVMDFMGDNMQTVLEDVDAVAIRVVNLDTPERGDPLYGIAGADAFDWFDMNEGQVCVSTAPGGGFDRLLGDFYIRGERGNTLTEWMLLQDWEPYVKGVKK